MIEGIHIKFSYEPCLIHSSIVNKMEIFKFTSEIYNLQNELAYSLSMRQWVANYEWNRHIAIK
jgi:hypothetical protein